MVRKKSKQLKKEASKSKRKSQKKRNVHALKRVSTKTVQSTDRQQYIFQMAKGDNLAEYDEAGGAQLYNLPEFVDYFDELKPGNWEELTRQLTIGIFIHEDMHRGITDSDIKTTVEQDHSIFDTMLRP